MDRFCKLLCIIIVWQLCRQVEAHDIHFSQFYASPQNLNPSLAGNFEGQYRLVMNNRNQWQSFTNGYRTFSASFDSRITNWRISGSTFGAGLLINSDRAGDGKMGITQVGISLSMQYDITGSGKYLVAAGICPSFSQYSIDFSKFTFNSQYNGVQFDAMLPSNENFEADRVSFFDLASGINFATSVNDNLSFTFGLAASHILRPLLSFNNDPSVKLKSRYQYHAIVLYKLRNDFIIYPSLKLSSQGPLKEFNWGGMAKLGLNNMYFQSFYFGGWNRWRDAVILKIGTDYQNINIGISYDINISKLTCASNGKGGFEFSLAYIFNLKKELKPVFFRQCPTFI